MWCRKILLQIALGPIQIIELSLWITSCVGLGIVGTFFILEYRNEKNKFFLWISLYFYLFIIARIFRLIVRFYYGDPPLGGTIEGTAFVLESIYTVVSFAGLFMVYYALEKDVIKKTHYLFSIVVWITTIVSIIDFIRRDLLWLTMPFFLVTVLGVPLIYISLAVKSSGAVRKKAVLVFTGIALFILGVIFDIPDAQFLWVAIPPDILGILAPCCHIISCFFLRKGFQRVG